jgi:dihydropteroate synthase
MILSLSDRKLELETPLIMGILNLTPDSFSDGGRYKSLDAALKRVEEMIGNGADIIDIGGESTRPGAIKVNSEEELKRVLPVIYEVKKRYNPILSIDTYKEIIARKAVEEAGADIINDISALRFSDQMAKTVARLKVPVILMHMQGKPGNMQNEPFYNDVIGEIQSFFKERIQFALDRGIVRDKMLIDPGIGFGKRFSDNIRIIKELQYFTKNGLPLVMGLSRKRFIAEITGEKIGDQRDVETVAANLISIQNGVSIIRVHNVKAARKSIEMLKALWG